MFAAIHLPDFYLQAALRFRREVKEKAIAIVNEADEHGLILEASLAAQKMGVAAGMPAPQALGRCPDLIFWPTDAEKERTVQAILLEVAHSLSPLVEATRKNLCMVDLCQAKAANGQTLGHDVVQRLADLELNAQIGFAPNPDLAWLAAQRAAPILVVQTPEIFLRELAISVIDPPADLLAILQGWGIHTLGQLTSLPRGELASRLGLAASQLWERAAGRTERPLQLVRPVEEFAESMDFEHEIEILEPLLFVLRRFLDQLALRLLGAHRVAARMTLTLPLEDATSHERIFTIPSPTAEPEVLFRILDTHLEGLQLEQRPTGIRLRIEPVRPDHNQLRLFENPLRDPNRFGETIARLTALVGAGNVGVAELENTHQPDRFQLVEPKFHQLKFETKVLAETTIGLPLHRYRPPIPASVHLVQHAPNYVVSEAAHGQVLEALGPYRLASHWWDDQTWEREEWDVEIATDGLYRLSQMDGHWQIEGCYDGALIRSLGADLQKKVLGTHSQHE